MREKQLSISLQHYIARLLRVTPNKTPGLRLKVDIFCNFTLLHKKKHELLENMPTRSYHVIIQSFFFFSCIPDPCILTVNGVRVGLTSSDVLFHLGKEEISYPLRSGDR